MNNIITYEKYNFKKIFENFTIEEFRKLEEEYKTYLHERNRSLGFIKYIPSEYNNKKDIFLEIKNYDVENNFKCNYKSGFFWIYPDESFLKLIQSCNDYFKLDLKSLKFYITITNLTNRYLNSIDIGDTIPENLKNLGLASKFYNLVINHIKFITTNRYANIIMYNIWYKLMIRPDLYSFTSTFMSGIISKDIEDNELLNILNDLKYYHNKYQFIFDNDLIKKINQFYGSLDDYK